MTYSRKTYIIALVYTRIHHLNLPLLMSPSLPAVDLANSTTVATSLTRPTTGTHTEAPDKPVALLVSHGMGQQVPFATLEDVVKLLQQPTRTDLTGPAPVVTHVRFLDPDSKRETWLARAEVELTDARSQQKRTVHVYENYWAPLTEGNISLSEVVRFMASAGWRGVRSRLLKGSTFQRWLFGKTREFTIPRKTVLGLFAALVLVLALVAINTLLTLVVGANLLSFSSFSKMPARLVDRLTMDLVWLLLPAVVAGLFLLWSEKIVENLSKLDRKVVRKVSGISKEKARAGADWRADKLVHWAVWGLLGVAGGFLVGMAGIMAWDYFTSAHTLAPKAPDPSPVLSYIWQLEQNNAWLRALPDGLTKPHWAVLLRMAFIGGVWGLTVGISLYLRGFLVQYMGDVAIYLDAYKVDKFHKVREEVKRQASQMACALYGARAATSPDPAVKLPFAYDRLVLVGHSLGSVVTYDALNATLHLDESMDRPLQADVRTGGLITFGSPLDKTAYLFHTQSDDTSVRPPLMASVQPLLRSWRVRNYVKWINIYSKNDVVSGGLDFYDAPADTQVPGYQPVENRIDADARTPLAAHVQYWKNEALATAIRERIFATRAASPVDQARETAPPVDKGPVEMFEQDVQQQPAEASLPLR
ncbi:hypothetical protein JAO73_05440 [Hymenobacter sp. BT523]|uniref:hypothetical protein n=1 Tax=Hymenobacter sp. BT523 TaxID=2795725 RepID=UPI0018ED5E98|nr:hypothetical protein [Hymenobacter sp. BT523]MBJ6108442.1 hypothetical protein [Hymenobacter sp. BT523]